MKPLLVIAVLFLLSSCSTPKPVALKGTYSNEPKVYPSSSSFDQVWDKLIDLFAQKGLSIKIIDRSSGLIISERSSLPYTTEFDNGKIKDSTAFVVVPKIYNANTKKYNPVYSAVSGEWNVRIKNDNGKSQINVNLVNIKGVGLGISGGQLAGVESICTSCRSTGNFEKIIADLIK